MSVEFEYYTNTDTHTHAHAHAHTTHTQLSHPLRELNYLKYFSWREGQTYAQALTPAQTHIHTHTHTDMIVAKKRCFKYFIGNLNSTAIAKSGLHKNNDNNKNIKNNKNNKNNETPTTTTLLAFLHKLIMQMAMWINLMKMWIKFIVFYEPNPFYGHLHLRFRLRASPLGGTRNRWMRLS